MMPDSSLMLLKSSQRSITVLAESFILALPYLDLFFTKPPSPCGQPWGFEALSESGGDPLDLGYKLFGRPALVSAGLDTRFPGGFGAQRPVDGLTLEFGPEPTPGI